MFDLSFIVKNKKLLIIDIDDTVLSYQKAHAIALNETLSKYNFTIDEYNNSKELVKKFIKGVNQHKKELYFKKMVEDSNHDYSLVLELTKTYNYYLFKHLVLDVSIKNLLIYCKNNNINICALSNFYSLDQIKKLKKLNILQYFNHIITSEDIDIEKPSPFIYSFILEKFNLKYNDAIMIGDSIVDMPSFGIDYYPYNCNNLFFAICGKSGCGKSTLAMLLKEIFGATIIEGDNYHKYERNSDMYKIMTHYDYRANNIDKMNDDIRKLFYLKNILLAQYDHTTGKFNNISEVKYNDKIIFEGLHWLNSIETNKFFKFKIFINNFHSDENKIKRDTRYRNKTKETVIDSINARSNDYDKFIYIQNKCSNMIFNYNETELEIVFTNEFNFDILKAIFEKLNNNVIIEQNQFKVRYSIANNIREYRSVIVKLFNLLKRNIYE